MSTSHHLHLSYSSSESGRAGGSPSGLQIITASGPGSSPAIVRASRRIASICCLLSRFFGSSPGVPVGARSSEGSREKLGGRRGKLGGRRFARAVGGALRAGGAALFADGAGEGTAATDSDFFVARFFFSAKPSLRAVPACLRPPRPSPGSMPARGHRRKDWRRRIQRGARYGGAAAGTGAMNRAHMRGAPRIGLTATDGRPTPGGR